VAVERALLLIADITGYTRFMRLHRMSLAHSQDVTARLLHAVVEAVPQLRLVEVEGDAAFFYVPLPSGDEGVSVKAAVQLALAMHHGFHAQQERMIALNMCSCDGCIQAGKLKVKFVAHVGEVATHKVKRRPQLAGVEVIAVHRMLKNAVPIPEYVLMSEPVYEGSEPSIRDCATSIDEELEGLGVARCYFVDIDGLAAELPPARPGTITERTRETMGVMCRSLPYLLGIRGCRFALSSQAASGETAAPL
jgi:class 3 adenylate cyclase